MTGVGLALIGLGAVMITTGSEPDPWESGFYVDWQVTGAIWTGAGVALTIVGLTRRR